jgi:hypothetical protein
MGRGEDMNAWLLQHRHQHHLSSSSYPEVRQLWSSIRSQCSFFHNFVRYVCALHSQEDLAKFG